MEKNNSKLSAVICFIIKNDKILLINKKRGFGAGKINGPGGKVEAGELPIDAAVRETIEEIGIRPENPQKRAELYFHFTYGLELDVVVFTAASYTGELIETDEAAPFWCGIKDIPFDSMWEDDIHWLPAVLSGKTCRAYFTFDDDEKLIKKKVELTDACRISLE
jgi:8-oxo-dGTP diphosphatase